MNIRTAAEDTRKLINGSDGLKRFDETHTSKDHLHMMTGKIILGEVTGEKAHRWLGWAQACIVMGGGATVEDMKLVNKQA